MSSVLVTGAAGKTGRAVVQALLRRDVSVRCLVRSTEQARWIEPLGGESVIADLTEESGLVEALRGCRAVYYICPNLHPQEVPIAQRLVAACTEAGCLHFVYHSVLHPQIEAMPHHWHKLQVEELLFESRLETTILQPCAYMQNLLAWWSEIETRGSFSVPYSVDAPFSWVDLEDVAEVAARVLTEPCHEGAIYELSGPETLSPGQLASLLSRRLGHRVHAQELPLKAWQKAARTAGIADYSYAALTAMFEYYDRHGLVGNPRVLEMLLGRSSTTFDRFIEREREARGRPTAPA